MWLELASEGLAGVSALLLWLPAWRLSRDLLAVKRLEPVAKRQDKLANLANRFSVALRKGHETFDARDHRQLMWGFACMTGAAILKVIAILTK